MHNKVLTLLYQKSRGFESLSYGHGVVIYFLLWNQDMIELRFYSSIPVYQPALAWNRKKTSNEDNECILRWECPPFTNQTSCVAVFLRCKFVTCSHNG